MFIIFGTRGIKHQVSNSEPLRSSCPSCQGDLEHKLYRRWFTLFFIPIIPLDELDRFYECNRCGNSYNDNVRNMLQQSQEDQERIQLEAQRLFAMALIASSTHMAMIDNHFAPEEKQAIEGMITQFPEMEQELTGIMEQVRTSGNQDNRVFNLLMKAREELSSEALLSILAQAGIVLLADGIIDKEEENLMKEYLIACGLPKDMYANIIEKLKAKEITQES